MTVNYSYWNSCPRPWLVIELIADIAHCFKKKSNSMFLGFKFIDKSQRKEKSTNNQICLSPYLKKKKMQGQFNFFFFQIASPKIGGWKETLGCHPKFKMCVSGIWYFLH